MNLFNKKNQLKFFNIIPGVEKFMPIIPAKNLSHEWKKQAAKKFNILKEKPENVGVSLGGVARCPGINLIQSQGWIIRYWQDLLIDTSEENTLVWKTPIDQKELCKENTIEFHSSSMLEDFVDPPPNSLNTILKLCTGWRVDIPKNHILMILPVFYSNDNRFSILPGSLTSDFGISQLNLQLYWNVFGKKEIIKKGTPLAQCILIPRKEYDYEISSKIHDSRLDEQNFVLGSSFLRNYKIIKDYYDEK